MNLQNNLRVDFAPEPEDVAPQKNFSYALSPDVTVSLNRQGPELLVVFGRKGHLADLVEDLDWSVLRVAAADPARLLDDVVAEFFDALTDGTLLDEFETVLFCGEGACAEAAVGYAICAPRSRVIVFSPTPGWRESGRYVADEASVQTVESMHVIYDPRHPGEADMAAALADLGAQSLPFRLGVGGGGTLDDLEEVGALEPVLEEAMTGHLPPAAFYASARARRSNMRYLRRLTGRLNAGGRHRVLHAVALRHIATHLNRGRSRRQFEEIAAELLAEGIRIPPARS